MLLPCCAGIWNRLPIWSIIFSRKKIATFSGVKSDWKAGKNFPSMGPKRGAQIGIIQNHRLKGGIKKSKSSFILVTRQIDLWTYHCSLKTLSAGQRKDGAQKRRRR